MPQELNCLQLQTRRCDSALRSRYGIWEHNVQQGPQHGVTAMTPEEALRNILKLVEGSDELEDAHALQILLQSIKVLAEKGLGRSNWHPLMRALTAHQKAGPRMRPGQEKAFLQWAL
jgi:hypothetical protein